MKAINDEMWRWMIVFLVIVSILTSALVTLAVLATFITIPIALAVYGIIELVKFIGG